MQGRRRDVELHKLNPGDFGRDAAGRWLCRAPNGFAGQLSRHEVAEHEDGTITVSPSILITRPPQGEWHGYLERGVWREV